MIYNFHHLQATATPLQVEFFQFWGQLLRLHINCLGVTQALSTTIFDMFLHKSLQGSVSHCCSQISTAMDSAV